MIGLTITMTIFSFSDLLFKPLFLFLFIHVNFLGIEVYNFFVIYLWFVCPSEGKVGQVTTRLQTSTGKTNETTITEKE